MKVAGNQPLSLESQAGQARERAQSKANHPDCGAHQGRQPFELLANYLEPHFGDIYDGSINEVQPWSDGLKSAVRSYLLHELPAPVWRELFNLARGVSEDGATRQAHVDGLLTMTEPWVVAWEVRKSAVIAVPTIEKLLDELGIADCEKWPSFEERDDVATWLGAHLNSSSINEDMLLDSYAPNRVDEALQRARRFHGNLSDDEWMMLSQAFHGGSRVRKPATRAAISGILYKHSLSVPWKSVPGDYGDPTLLYQRDYSYRKQGTYQRWAARLEDFAGAADLVRLLKLLDTKEL